MLNEKTFIEKAKKIHGNKYNYDNINYENKYTKVTITCLTHGDFKQTPYSHIKYKQGCPKCAKDKIAKVKRLTSKDFIERSKKIHGNKYCYKKTKYINAKTKIKIGCAIHGYFEQEPFGHLRGHGCKNCGNILGLKEWKKRASKKHNNKYNYDSIDYIKKLTDKVMIKCPIHGDFRQLASIHMNGSECPKCSNIKGRLTRQEFINRSNKMHLNKYSYDKVNFINTKTKVEIVCKEHGSFMQIPEIHMTGSGCPICNISKGEQKIAKFLSYNNIDYIKEFKFKGSEYRYDFYLPDLNMIIEYDGVQHFKPVKRFGGVKKFQLNQVYDNEKNLICSLLNIPMLRIKYTEYDDINNIIINFIKQRFPYRFKNIFYSSFFKLAKALKLDDDHTSNDVRPYLTKLKSSLN